MRILCYIDSMGRGGAQRVMCTLMNSWATIGHNVTLVTHRGESSAYALSTKIEKLDLGETRQGGIRAILRHLLRLPRLRQVIRSVAPEVAISFGDTSNVRILMASQSLPVVVSERIDPTSGHKAPAWCRLLRRWFYRKARALVVQHDGQARFFCDMTHRVEIIPNPVDLERVPPATAEQRGTTILAAGRLHTQKGFDLLIRAFASISAQHPQWSMTIRGEGAERAALEALIKQNGMEERISLPGTVDDLMMELKQCGCFVLSSRFEGMPNVLLEAMAAAAPILATRCSPSVSEMLTNQENSLLVSPDDQQALADGLAQLLVDVNLRARIGPAARKAIDPFDLPNVIPLWEALLNSVVEGETKHA